MRIILVVLDGLGDRSYDILNQRTPLQAAETPNLDRLAQLGSNGLFHAGLLGQCLPSETAHYLLFGYDLENFPGRGLLEAVGDGVAFNDKDILCLAHLSSVTWKEGLPILTQGQKDIEGDAEEIGQLFDAITPYKAHDIRFRLQKTGRNDAILVVSGPASPHVSDSDPMVPGRAMARIFPLAKNPEPEEAEKTAKALNAYLAYCYRVLTHHEVNQSRRNRNLPLANFLATHRCGRRIVQEPFSERFGLAGMSIAAQSVYAGLAHELGLSFIRAKDGHDPAKDLRERIQLALSSPSLDFIHVHTKVPDEAAHTGDPRNKVSAIVSLDQGLGGLVEAVEKKDDLFVVVTADHSTPSGSMLIHSGESVPVVMVGKNVRRDEVNAFDEVSAAGGCLGLLRGRELMLSILNYADHSALLGHRLGKTETAYVSQTYETFQLTD